MHHTDTLVMMSLTVAPERLDCLTRRQPVQVALSVGSRGEILYGLGAIKGAGAALRT